MTELTAKTAYEIMDLLDENPSEPFSLERKWLIEKLINKLTLAWDAFEHEAESNYDIGYQNGYDEGFRIAEEDAEETIKDLETAINDLEIELEDAKNDLDDSFAKGYETASRDQGGLESFELS